ncbi:hypothetical protein LTR56_004948 [Elasticomyces elasticus]|nr:hypothetical protein LTR22_015763 [Elasticomyces elasticus]KAK3652654.1 hypothetical protein LTR56_004948 [Elasticomyces elasticus]KAK4914584.1 hypothetical protein LTR49_017151 [Elasticomyces elasticus]KAK5753950.1 hypothetical protein LTS12_015916 [Elasticomyces elasticus]
MADANIAPLDRIPAGIRVQIFGLALRCDVPVVLATKSRNDNSTALLIALVNDQKYGEACEAFYESNTFRLTSETQLGDIMTASIHSIIPGSHITHLEWPYLGRTTFTGPNDINRIVDRCSPLPKLKSLLVLYEQYYFPCDLIDHIEKVDEKLASRLVCVGVGHFTLRATSSLVVHIQRPSLKRAWQAMKLSERRTFEEVVDIVVPGWEAMDDASLLDAMQYLFHVNLRLPEWAVCFDEYRRRETTDTTNMRLLSRAGQQILDNFREDFRHFSSVGKIFERMAAGTSFRDIDEGTCDEDLLAEIDWVMIANEGMSLHLS